jgi:hypothetical protein
MDTFACLLEKMARVAKIITTIEPTDNLGQR